MPAPTDFRLYHSNALDVLAAVLAERLRAPLPGDDWLRPEIVLVPQFSMRRWLQQSLAERTGICANVRFLTPGEFVDLALDANLGAVDGGQRLRPQSLRWSLLRLLRDAPPEAWRGFVAGGDAAGDGGRKAWSLACALAGTFEKYQAWRRDLLLRWEAGAEPDDPQAQLWRQVAAGRAHRARRIGAYLARFGAQVARVPVGLPPRLSVFACQNVSPDVLQVIASQARAGLQEFYLHTPSRAFWGDLGRWARDYVPADDAAFASGNPLLAAWGQAERDFVAALGSGDAVHARYEAPAFVEPSRATLLGQLQADVLDNTDSSSGNSSVGDSSGSDPPQSRVDPAMWPRQAVDRGDASLQFHACHTRLREVQVLHDQLRALLEADAPDGGSRLQPRGIAVLAPDIDLYAPHIEAVFGGAMGTSRELPYTIADTSPLASEAMADAFARLLDLPLRAPGLAGVLDLIAVPAVAARFGIDDAMRGSLQGWLQAAGARWGFDAADRARDGRGDGDAYTFAFALDRLLLGYAAGDETDIAGVAPWPGVEGQSALALDALLRVLDLLRAAGRDLAGPHPPREWAARLERLLVALFGDEPRDPRDARTLARLRQAVAAFAEGAAEAGFEDAVEYALVRDQLLADLREGDARAPFLSGGICFGRMVPMRLIPFQVICLLGMDDGAFPGGDARDPLNRIVQALATDQRQVGDPSRRDADRYLFLQLFASASRTFYLSWQGFDARDGSARAPASVVAELLDTAARQHAGDSDGVREALVVRHALQPFSPAAFGAAHVDERVGDPRRFSFDARWRVPQAASVQELPVFAPVDAATARDVVAAGGRIELDALRRALVQPQALYLREGLGLRLPEDEPPLDEHEPFGAPDALGMHGLRAQVFEAWLRDGARPDVATLHARLLARAQVAPGADGRATLARLLDAIAPFAGLALASGFRGAGQTVPVEVALGDTTLVGRLRGAYPQGLLRVALRSGGLHGGHVLRHRLDALVASTLGLTVYELRDGRKGEAPHLGALPRLPPDVARAALESLLALQRRMRQSPLAFLPKSGFAFWTVADTDADAGMRAARTQWIGGDYVHAEADMATQLALRGREPFVDGDGASRAAFEAASRAIFAALVDGTPFDADAVLA
ncbi:exodeoxyribonuclease V subunit gamma [Cognatiluteimonas profundi]|uniref:exodeoxyribonuclease V subunit gamma n=1 Tax=Cognatiluteimonas profundi TaxID=2594501 RepID=UPI00131BBC3A|nr:exodeoxyribonuclease V subunit gamma [Lysobacter profundi]